MRSGVQVAVALEAVTADVAKAAGGGSSDDTGVAHVGLLLFWKSLMTQALENAAQRGEVVPKRHERRLVLSEAPRSGQPASRAPAKKRSRPDAAPTAKERGGSRDYKKARRQATSTIGQATITIGPQNPLLDLSGTASSLPPASWNWGGEVGPSGDVEVLWLNTPGCKPSSLVYSFDLDGEPVARLRCLRCPYQAPLTGLCTCRRVPGGHAIWQAVCDELRRLEVLLVQDQGCAGAKGSRRCAWVCAFALVLRPSSHLCRVGAWRRVQASSLSCLRTSLGWAKAQHPKSSSRTEPRRSCVRWDFPSKCLLR